MIQEQNNYCLCAVLQDILSEYSIFISQKDISKELTPNKKGFDVDGGKIKKFMKKQGFNYEFYWYNKTPFNEPDMLLENISNNNGFVGINNHVYKIKDFNYPILTFCNPKDESIQKESLSDLIKKFIKQDGGFGLITRLPL